MKQIMKEDLKQAIREELNELFGFGKKKDKKKSNKQNNKAQASLDKLSGTMAAFDKFDVKEGVGDPLPVLEKVVGELVESAKEMEEAPSHVPASDFANHTNEMAMKIREAILMMGDDGNE